VHDDEAPTNIAEHSTWGDQGTNTWADQAGDNNWGFQDETNMRDASISDWGIEEDSQSEGTLFERL
jgi:hypothetical protein